jgi:hypothetical protein
MDMQLQHHVNNLPPGYWPRCRDVTIRGGLLHCGLNLKDLYNLTDAYSDHPHVSFLRMQTEEDLRNFTLMWGPLVRSDFSRGEIKTPVAWCWSYQRRLAALVKLSNAIRNREKERAALEEFVTAEWEHEGLFSLDARNCWSLFILARFFPAGQDPMASLRDAEMRTVRVAAIGMIRATPVVACSASFDVKLARRPEIVARWTIDTLDNALRWMAWRDEWRGQPLSYCAECDEAFCPASKHRRKYCSYKCGHKVAARRWARKRRSEHEKPTSAKRRST